MKKEILRDKLVWPLILGFFLTTFNFDLHGGLLWHSFRFILFTGAVSLFTFLRIDNYLSGFTTEEDKLHLTYTSNFSSKEHHFTIDLSTVTFVKFRSSRVTPFHSISIAYEGEEDGSKDFVIKVKRNKDFIGILHKLKDKTEEIDARGKVT
ncbi:hypothetical protein AB9P05_03920 [Roseivirga sp. BDSF3-8]|uniref:hypothetical protein n=1 Tax=Roseivirga sp. BDSF3-8 TaxID=3241598 RepID=UPI0035326E2F